MVKQTGQVVRDLRLAALLLDSHAARQDVPRKLPDGPRYLELIGDEAQVDGSEAGWGVAVSADAKEESGETNPAALGSAEHNAPSKFPARVDRLEVELLCGVETVGMDRFLPEASHQSVAKRQ
ncbi:hypothetical protein [Streptomyces sp. NPDC056480]|uniref:hypothetical protein n=1 Tax=Streptomyces sp. NPDC056480 TaxID=3345833 RepID=UPI00369AA73F